MTRTTTDSERLPPTEAANRSRTISAQTIGRWSVPTVFRIYWAKQVPNDFRTSPLAGAEDLSEGAVSPKPLVHPRSDLIIRPCHKAELLIEGLFSFRRNKRHHEPVAGL